MPRIRSNDWIVPDALGLTDKMPKGQYAGELVGTVIEINPTYMNWAMQEWDLRWKQEVEDYLKEYL